jgi:hypothetical protein
MILLNIPLAEKTEIFLGYVNLWFNSKETVHHFYVNQITAP